MTTLYMAMVRTVYNLRLLSVETISAHFCLHKSVGPLTSPAILNSHGFISSKYASRKDWPDLQIYLVGLGVYSELVQDQARTLGFNATSYTEYMRPLLNQELDGFGIMATLVLPKSVGEIKLHDKNPFTPPLIDPKYLEDIRDVKTLIEG